MNNKMIPDSELKQLQLFIADGDSKSFRKLFNFFTPQLIYFAKSFVYHQQPAVELVDDVFVKIWRNKERISEIKNIKTYLYTSVKHAAYSFLVAKAEERTSDPLSTVILDFSAEHNPETQLISTELFTKIQKEVNNLPPRCKIIFQLVKENGLSYKEVADILDISVKTVDAQLVLAIKKMHEKLSNSEFNLPKLKKSTKTF